MPVMDGPDDLLVIGRFARLAGLTVGALRHYDEVDLLRPAKVDPETGYRSYRRDQLDAARMIVRLRDLEVPLETIRAYLAADDPNERRRLMADHRRRIEARTFRLQRVLHVVGQLAGAPDQKESGSMTAHTMDHLTSMDPASHKELGSALFNHVWTLLEATDRTRAQDDEMIHAAHASRFHWARAEGTGPVNHARGEWQCSRVYAVLGRAEPALWHAERCREILEGSGIGDFDIAAAYEALARAHAVAGDPETAGRWRAKATAALDGIADPDDREIIAGDIDTIPLPDGG
jgi:DNA-binding transcriptional MerR regulator